jgi:hypothetical protein
MTEHFTIVPKTQKICVLSAIAIGCLSALSRFPVALFFVGTCIKGTRSAYGLYHLPSQYDFTNQNCSLSMEIFKNFFPRVGPVFGAKLQNAHMFG